MTTTTKKSKRQQDKENDITKLWAKNVRRYFSKEEILMANKHIKETRQESSKKIQKKNKTQSRYLLTPLGWLYRQTNKCWPGCQYIRTLTHS